MGQASSCGMVSKPLGFTHRLSTLPRTITLPFTRLPRLSYKTLCGAFTDRAAQEGIDRLTQSTSGSMYCPDHDCACSNTAISRQQRMSTSSPHYRSAKRFQKYNPLNLFH